jgi:hypothetical protein
MALPVTVASSTETSNTHNPPHLLGGNVYVIAKDSLNLECYKATDPTSSFSKVGTSPGTVAGFITSVNDGSRYIHVIRDRNQILDYDRFDTNDDSWDTPTGAEDPDLPSDSQDLVWKFCSIAVRSDGDVVVAHQSRPDRVMGNDKQRVDYALLEGTTWTKEVALGDTSADVHHGNPNVVLGVDNDEMHFIYQMQTAATPDPNVEFSTVQGQTLDSSNNLSTAGGDTNGDTLYALRGISNIVAWNDGSDDVVGFYHAPGGTGGDADCFGYVAEDASGDLDFASGFTRATDIWTRGGTNATPHWQTGSAQNTAEFVFTSFVADQDTGDIWCVFSGGVEPSTSDQDVYYSKSEDDGATWSDPVEHMDGVTADGVSAAIYTRSGSKVLAYIINDIGTGVKYNEIALSEPFLPFFSRKDNVLLKM